MHSMDTGSVNESLPETAAAWRHAMSRIVLFATVCRCMELYGLRQGGQKPQRCGPEPKRPMISAPADGAKAQGQAHAEGAAERGCETCRYVRQRAGNT